MSTKKIFSKKYYWLWIILLFSMIVWIFSMIASKNNLATVEINNQTFDCFVAKSNWEKYQGLSDRRKLEAKQGMIFVFQQETPEFVMRNMKFPLDIIFINQGKITKIYKNLKPEGPQPQTRYPATGVTDYVLEINAGLSDKYNFKINDEVKINFLN